MNYWRVGIAVIVLSTTVFAQNNSDMYDKLTGKNWYGIYMDSSKVGHAYIALEKSGEKQWTSTTKLLFRIAMQNTTGTIDQSETRIYEGGNGEMVNESYSISSPTGNITVEGAIVGDSFNIITTIAGQKSQKALKRPVETLGDYARVQLLALAGKLKTDDTISFITYIPDPPISAPLMNLARVISVSQTVFNGIPTNVYSINDSILALGISSDVIFTDNGIMLEMSLGGSNMRMQLEPEEVAKIIGEPYDILNGQLIKVENGPTDSRKIKQATYLVTGYDTATIPISDWLKVQSFSPESAMVTVAIDTMEIGKIDLPISGDEFASFVLPEPLLQSDNPEIISMAREIVGNEKNALAAAKLINDWVYKNIEKQFSPEISNALTTLHSRKGDCGEHAALAVGLLRAVGIPSRIASGVVYWPEGRGFAYHAWTEVYLGKWIQMDPTSGETFANATHIMLTNGGYEKQLSVIIKAMKGLKIKFVSFE
jgi:hypothetical protein